MTQEIAKQLVFPVLGSANLNVSKQVGFAPLAYPYQDISKQAVFPILNDPSVQVGKQVVYAVLEERVTNLGRRTSSSAYTIHYGRPA